MSRWIDYETSYAVTRIITILAKKRHSTFCSHPTMFWSHPLAITRHSFLIIFHVLSEVKTAGFRSPKDKHYPFITNTVPPIMTNFTVSPTSPPTSQPRTCKTCHPSSCTPTTKDYAHGLSSWKGKGTGKWVEASDLVGSSSCCKRQPHYDVILLANCDGIHRVCYLCRRLANWQCAHRLPA